MVAPSDQMPYGVCGCPRRMSVSKSLSPSAGLVGHLVGVYLCRRLDRRPTWSRRRTRCRTSLLLPAAIERVEVLVAVAFLGRPSGRRRSWRRLHRRPTWYRRRTRCRWRCSLPAAIERIEVLAVLSRVPGRTPVIGVELPVAVKSATHMVSYRWTRCRYGVSVARGNERFEVLVPVARAVGVVGVDLVVGYSRRPTWSSPSDQTPKGFPLPTLIRPSRSSTAFQP